MCLPYTVLANSVSSNYPVLVLHCKVPANNGRFAGGSYKALLLSLPFAGTLWWQLKRDGPGVVHIEAVTQARVTKRCRCLTSPRWQWCSLLPIIFKWRWVLSSTNSIQATCWLRIFAWLLHFSYCKIPCKCKWFVCRSFQMMFLTRKWVCDFYRPPKWLQYQAAPLLGNNHMFTE